MIDPRTTHDPRFPTLDELDAGFRSLPSPPLDIGRVRLIVCRSGVGTRTTPDRVRLTPEEGLPGDSWIRKEGATTDSQVTLMRADIAGLIAAGRPPSLVGDNLLVDLDLSIENLPPGSRLRIGRALVEVTPKIHKGCKKISQRFGVDSLRFVSTPEGRRVRLRGLYVRVLAAGEVAAGDAIGVLERARSEEAAV